MSDVHEQLYRIAEGQAGHFTAAQAVEAGMDRATLRHHARRPGRYERVQRGLYRLRHFPASPHGTLSLGGCHLGVPAPSCRMPSALDLYGITDVLPTSVHLSVSKAKRGVRPRAGVRVRNGARATVSGPTSR